MLQRNYNNPVNLLSVKFPLYAKSEKGSQEVNRIMAMRTVQS